jgi:cyclase
VIDIPFCVAGGIKSADDAHKILSFGADKISINSPALADPELITRLADRFGVQCIVVGIDTWFDASTGKYHVNQYTGDESRTRVTTWETLDWVQEVQKRGAGEIVLNMMNQDGVRNGYDLEQLKKCARFATSRLSLPAARVPWNTSLRPSATPTSTARWRHRCSISKLSILVS